MVKANAHGTASPVPWHADWAQRLTLGLVACLMLAVAIGGILRMLDVRREATVAATPVAAAPAPTVEQPRPVETVLASRQVIERMLALSGELVARDEASTIVEAAAEPAPSMPDDPQAEVARRMSEVDVPAAREGLLWMLDRGRVEFEATIRESELVTVVEKAGVPVVVPGIAGTLEGHVRLIAPRADQATGLGLVRIALPDDERLRPGTLARAEFVVEQADVLAIPQSAIDRDDATGAAAVFVVDADNRLELRPVETGAHEEGMVEIVAGLAPTERVALDASDDLRAGDRVASADPRTAVH